jgi:hypothetical protein
MAEVATNEETATPWLTLADDIEYLERKAQTQSLDPERCKRVRDFVKALRSEEA